MNVPSGAEPPPGGQRSPRPLSLWLIGSITVTGILGNTLIYPAIPDILDDLGIDDGSAGILVAAASIPGIVIAPLVGVLADRFGRKRILVPCLVLFGLFGAMAAFSPTFTWLLIARFGQGIGSAGLINLATILISDTWSGVDRARILGYNSAVLTVSLAVMPAVGGLLTDLGSWRWSFAPYPLALVTAAIIMARLAPDSGDRSTSIGAQVVAAARAARRPAVLAPLGLAFITFFIMFGLFLTVMPLHLEDEFGLAARERGFILAVPAIGATVGALILGRVRARWRPRLIVIFSFVMFSLSYPLVGVTGALALVVVASLMFGLGEGLVLPTLTDVVAESAPESSRGAVLSLQVSAIRAGQSVGPLVAGASVTAIGTNSTFLVGGAIALAVVVVTSTLGLAPRVSKDPSRAAVDR